jgi:hypothetical protein
VITICNLPGRHRLFFISNDLSLQEAHRFLLGSGSLQLAEILLKALILQRLRCKGSTMCKPPYFFILPASRQRVRVGGDGGVCIHMRQFVSVVSRGKACTRRLPDRTLRVGWADKLLIDPQRRPLTLRCGCSAVACRNQRGCGRAGRARGWLLSISGGVADDLRQSTLRTSPHSAGFTNTMGLLLA